MSAAPTVVVEPVFLEEGDNFPVTPDSTDRIQPARAAPLEGGGYVLTWVQGEGNSQDERIYAQVFGPDNVALGAAFAVAPGLDIWQRSPSVVTIADGGFVIGFSVLENNTTRVLAQRYDAAGQTTGEAITVATIAGAPFAPTLADFSALPGGGFLATWNTYDGPGGSDEINGRLYDGAGAPLGAAFQINAYTTDSQNRPDTAVFADGTFVVVWQSIGQDGSGSGIYGQMFSAAGSPVGSEFRVNTVTTGGQTSPRVAALEDGGFVVTWEQPDIIAPTAVKAQVFDGTGTALGGEIMVDSFHTATPNPDPAVVGLPDGGFVIAWRKASDTIKAQRYDADGSPRGTSFDVSTSTPGEIYYRGMHDIIVTDDDELMVFWHSAQSPNANDSDILAQSYLLGNRATEQVALVLANPITVGDDGVGTNVVTVTLSVDYGVLTVATGGSGVSASGNGTSSVVLTGTVDQLNALLTGGAGSPVSYLADTDAPPTAATLTVEVRDGEDQTATSSAAIAILAVNDPAVANPDAGTTDEATVHVGNVLADNGSGADYDPDGPALSVAAVNGSALAIGVTTTLASGALLTMQADGNFVYDPNGQFNALPAAGSGASNLTAQDSFTYTLAGGGTATVTVTITGLDSDDTLQGTAGNDTLTAGIGNDTLDGGPGADTMIGGAGDDRYYVDNYSDVIVEGAAGGFDTVVLAASYYELGANVQVERIETGDPMGTSTIGVYANDYVHTLIGNNGANYFQAGAGNDTIEGLGGNDNLFGNDGDDVIEGGDGDDYLVGGTGNDTIRGGAGNDTVYGGEGADVLRGEDGSDLLYGGFGDDHIQGGDGADVIEGDGFPNGVTDWGDDLLEGGAGNDLIRGNDGNDTIYGGADNDELHGGAGQDYIDGGDGDDFIIGNEGSVDVEADALLGGAGNDRIIAGYGDRVDGGAGSDTLYLNLYHGAPNGVTADFSQLANNGVLIVGGAQIDNIEFVGGLSLTQYDDVVVAGPIPEGVTGISIDGWGGNDDLTGTAGVDSIYGGDGNDVIRGNGGNNPAIAPSGDRLYGEGGNDVIHIGAAAGPVGTETIDGGAGFDRLSVSGVVDFRGNLYGIEEIYLSPPDGTSLTIASAYFASLPSVALTGTGALTVLVAANGTFDAATLNVANGASITMVLNGSTGNETLLGTGGNDILNGNAGNDVLDGRGGADAMAGGEGNDVYLIDDAGDTVTELAAGGYDTVFASFSYTLGAHVERLLAYDPASTAALALTGNTLDNEITGNAGANVIDGGAGADFMSGRAGDDIYFVDHAGDYVYEGTGDGYDTVFATVSYTLGSAVERVVAYDQGASDALNFTGNALDNEITGNAGANVIDGGAGADFMSGRAGDDIYFVDHAGDYVYEGSGEGYDTVFASVSYTLGSAVERVVAFDPASTTALSFTGNALDNEITGNAGANLIDGGVGADFMTGHGGDDIYFVDNAGDFVLETAGNGYDTVFASVSHTLAAHVERVIAFDPSSTSALSFTGNALSNEISGNAGGNLIDGGAGADVLFGNGGDDAFAFTSALGGGNVDTLVDFQPGGDRIYLDDAVFTGLAGGTLSASAFHTGSAAADADDRIIYDPTTGALFFDADGNGAGAAVQFAWVSDGLVLAASDFAVI